MERKQHNYDEMQQTLPVITKLLMSCEIQELLLRAGSIR